ncbi:anti-sigma factor RsbA family regulatory protein [Actinoplanes subtropicus]|uniref:anti-sigma factor RsbA family regulatory protein n=1 Tax=Actinoplanes subtropicus TaxID=543632 RepID=UPI0005597BD9|nr:anti-sigma factor RsbA family regulatory protein [Actinoplanes subtropicus]
MSTHTSLAHDAMFYGSDEEFLAVLVPFVREGLTGEEAVTAALTADNIALLRDALGVDAAAVSFIDRDEWYSRPTTTIAGWREVLRQGSRHGHTQFRLIGEVGFGPTDRHVTWSRYEAALNDVFAGAPAWIVCPYDTRALPPTVLTDARRTHPTVIDDVRRDSDQYLPAEDFLRTVPEPLPAATDAPVLQIPVTMDGLATRQALREALAAQGWGDPGRLQDLLLVATELITNSLRHGRGHRELRLWISGRTVTGEVTDEGDGPGDPLAGYRPPENTLPGGRGLWLANQLCDALTLSHQEGTTRARFTMTAPAPDKGNGRRRHTASATRLM